MNIKPLGDRVVVKPLAQEEKTKSGGRLIENRIAWGKSYLKKGGLVHYPQRGYVQITEKGKSKSQKIFHLLIFNLML